MNGDYENDYGGYEDYCDWEEEKEQKREFERNMKEQEEFERYVKEQEDIWEEQEQSDQLLHELELEEFEDETRKETQMYIRTFSIVRNEVSLDIPTHCFGRGQFKLHGLPDPQPGIVIGLVGEEGSGKTTSLKIMAGEMLPNLGQFENPPEFHEILEHFDEGCYIIEYLRRLQAQTLKVTTTHQDIQAYKDNNAHIPCARFLLSEDARREESTHMTQIFHDLELNQEMLDCSITELSNSDLQRILIASTALTEGDVYIFDEPTHFLDANQKLFKPPK